MASNVDVFDTAGLEEAWYGFKDTNNIYGIGSGKTLSSGSSAGSGFLRMIETFALSPVAPRVVTTQGNDGPGHTFIFPPVENPNGTVTLGAFLGSFYALQQNMNLYSYAEWDVTLIQPTDFQLLDMYLILNSQAKSFDSDSPSATGFVVTIYPNVQIYPSDAPQFANAAPTQFEHVAVANKTNYWPTGKALSESLEGDDEAVGMRFYSPYKVTLHAALLTASAATFSLDKTPASDAANKVRLLENGTELTWTASSPGTGEFSLTAKTVSVGASATSSRYVVVLYQYSD